jgi:hypothetical protein
LRLRESVIDDESERAVSRWVRLGDQVSGRPAPDAGAECARCGSTHEVLDREQALCARCYLESGPAITGAAGAPALPDEQGEPPA